MSERVYPPAEDTNQAKDEPIPVSPTASDDPSVGADHPQAPRGPAGSDGSAQGAGGAGGAAGGAGGAGGRNELGGSATQAAQEGHPLAEGKTAGEHPASQAVIGRAKAPDGEVSPR